MQKLKRLISHSGRSMSQSQDQRAQFQEQWPQLLQAGLEAAAHGVLITDRDGAILWINPELTKMTGYELEDIRGKNPRIFKSGVQDEAFYRNMWSTLQSGQTWRGEVVNRCKDGSLYPEKQSIQPLYIDSNEITHFIAIKEDITEQKKLQAEGKELERLQMVKKLAAGTAHQINNPLSFLRANLEYLQRQFIDDDADKATFNISAKDARELLEETLEGSRRIEAITSALHTMSKDAQEVLLIPTDLRRVSELAIQHVLDGTLQLERDYGSERVEALASETQLLQLLADLLDNAKRALAETTDTNTNYIRVATGLRQDKAFIEISDTGVGIDSEELPHIFEPYYSTRSGGDGVGLGLVRCRNIVDRLKGNLEVKSKLGSGTTFRVLLPAAQ